MSFKRVNTEAIGGSDTLGAEHNILAGAKKTIPVLGHLKYLGAGSGADLQVAKGALLSCYNNSGTVAFIKMSKAAIGSDPSAAGADIVHLKPNDYTTIAIGANTVVRSSANVTVYELVDNSKLIEE
jgi:hypothetical protein